MARKSKRGWWGAALLLPMLVLGACGFQLQGRQALPAALASVYIDATDRQSDFTRALRIALKASGARLAESGSPDVAVVRIVRDDISERVLSVDARNIPTDFELTYDVEVRVSLQGKDLLPAEQFSLSRIYSFDERKLLAKEREKEVLKEALARDMASVVTRRLSSLE
jgi:LPS-assembly lipoprotein